MGGGEGASIGAVHRIAARLDDRYALVAGALSSASEEADRSPPRHWGSTAPVPTSPPWRAEAARADGIEGVAIVTPNPLHAAAAHAFPDPGIHVLCDEPLTTTLFEGR